MRMRTRASSVSGGRTKITPSAPTPKLRSHMLAACVGVSGGSAMSRQSSSTKSLPSPWYLVNGSELAAIEAAARGAVTGATPTVRDGDAEKRDSILDVAAGHRGARGGQGSMDTVPQVAPS